MTDEDCLLGMLSAFMWCKLDFCGEENKNEQKNKKAT